MIVCKLLKLLYKLKKFPKLWYKRLSNLFFEKIYLQQINIDYSIFVFAAGINSLIVSIFVDNIKIIGVKNSGLISRVKEKLTVVFKIVDMNPISFYLSLKVS